MRGIHKVVLIDKNCSEPDEAFSNLAPRQLRIIKRNGTVVPFDAGKIAIAMTKAFLAVEAATDGWKKRYAKKLSLYHSIGSKNYRHGYLLLLAKIAVIKGLNFLFKGLKFGGASLQVRYSPNLFGCMRYKLMPQNDGKSDSIVWESVLQFSFLHNQLRSFYGKSKNFIRD
jgi:hypothetical protein